MCSRYKSLEAKDIRPGDETIVYTVHGPQSMRWGFSMANKKLLINARSETAADKPLFRKSMQNGRCIVKASVFYEWDTQKRCHSYESASQSDLYLAALYTTAENNEYRFVILTQESHGDARRVHPRMPCCLPTEEYRYLWLHDNVLAPSLLQEHVSLHIERLPQNIQQLSIIEE